MIDQVHITTQRHGDVFVMRIEHPSIFADEVCVELRDLLVKFIKQTKAPRIVIDMSRIQELGSRFLGALIMLRKTADSCGGKLLLSQMSDQVAMSFRVAGLNKTIRTVSSLDNAISEMDKD